MNANKIKISVLVCTLNEEININKRLLNLRNLIIPEEVYLEIIVLDNGSTDKTKLIVKKLSKELGYKISLKILPPIGKCAALFWAFKNINSNYYLLTDANTVFSNNILIEFYKIISKNPNFSIITGNSIVVSSEKEGDIFIDRKNSKKLSLMFEFKKKFNIFTGAKGACYLISRRSILNIWKMKPVRNDDFIISIYSASNGGFYHCSTAKSYELELFNINKIFHAKYRDALGHAQAIKWILLFTPNFYRSLTTITIRICFWLMPILIFYCILFFNYYLYCLIVISFIDKRIFKLFIRTLALYLGLVNGLIKSPSVNWKVIR